MYITAPPLGSNTASFPSALLSSAFLFGHPRELDFELYVFSTRRSFIHTPFRILSISLSISPPRPYTVLESKHRRPSLRGTSRLIHHLQLAILKRRILERPVARAIF